MRITRRQLLAFALGFHSSPRLARGSTARPARVPMSPQQGAEFVASWELAAIQQNFPAWWDRLNYTGLIRWSPGVAILYGVGDVRQAEADYAGAGGWLATLERAGRLRRLAAAQSPCGRSWAIVVDGLAPGQSRPPARSDKWKLVVARALLDFEHQAGRPRLRTFHV